MVSLTIDEFRLEMGAYRQSADEENRSLTSPHIVHESLCSLFGAFDSTERQMAEQVIAEWAVPEDEAIRFDALALISDLRINAAIPALQKLATRLASQVAPSAPFELEKVRRIVAQLTA